MNSNEKAAVDTSKPGSQVQGEGDYESARRYREDTEQFLERADTTDLAKRAAPKSKEEADELKKAEEIGRSHRAEPAGTDSKSLGAKGATSQRKQ